MNHPSKHLLGISLIVFITVLIPVTDANAASEMRLEGQLEKTVEKFGEKIGKYEERGRSEWLINNLINQRDKRIKSICAKFERKNFEKPSICGDQDGSEPPVPPEDTEAPVVDIISPEEGSVVVGTTTVSAVVSDNEAVNSVMLSINNTEIAGSFVGDEYTALFASTEFENGTATILAKATDTSGNMSTSSINVVVSNEDESEQPTLVDHIVISEVYYDVDGAHGSEENEWVELYNGTEMDIDIGGWSLFDGVATDTIPASTTIAHDDFVIIARGNVSTSTAKYWGYEGDPRFVLIEGPIGNGLGNSGDKLYLMDILGEIVDALSWGSNVDIFNPPIPDVEEGHSIQRIDYRIDTDTEDDWMDQVTATPLMM